MPSFRSGKVTRLLVERPGLQRVEVDLGEGPEPAYVLTQLTGTVAVGDRIVVNTTAVELGLGTGGWHVVHWNLERESWAERGPGHIIKGRYTSLQADVAAPKSTSKSWPRSSRSTVCRSWPQRCTVSSRRRPSRSRSARLTRGWCT